MRRPLLIVLFAAVAGGALAASVSGSAVHARGTGGPDSLTQPPLDGCARDRGAILARQVPNWVYVGGDAGVAQSTFASGLVESRYDVEQSSHPSPVDDPFTHTSYDFVFNLKVDPAYSPLLATGNFEGKEEETARLHAERESRSFPAFAWPDRGDRVAVTGSWVWDCDHTGSEGERTEIHPFRELWVERKPGGPSPRSASGDREADLFVTNVETPADRQALCGRAHKDDRAGFRACVTSESTRWYGALPAARFVLRAGPKPSRSARLVYRVVDRGSSLPVSVRRLSAGVEVSFAANAEARPVEIAKQIFVGWRRGPHRLRPVHLRVHLRQLLVRRAMDPGCPPYDLHCRAQAESTRIGQVTTAPGEWNVYVDAGGVWAPWRPLLLRPHDGQRIRSRQSIDFYVARGKPWRLFVQTRECDFGSLGNAYSADGRVWPCPHSAEVGNSVGDDEPGIVVAHFRSPGASLGVHQANARLDGSTCPSSNRHGCYRLTYSVTRVGR